jgi:hydrogenase nickel incorporation protein HypB
MCVTCGCGNGAKVRIEGVEEHTGHEHVHVLADGTRIVHSHEHGPNDHPRLHGAHSHEHDHAHEHAHAAIPFADAVGEVVHLETALLDKNQRIAERNRAWMAARGVVALNLMSSPGAGKTSLLVRTLTDLRDEVAMTVVEGDQETSADADRIRATGACALQINTGTGCHLEADMIERALHELSPPPGILFVENVGNLVCPALFDLGEAARVVMLSVTEGEDKPLKYPHMFRSAQLMLLTKTDLLPYVNFNADRAEAHAREINPDLRSLRVSVTSGDGLGAWYAWLRSLCSGVQQKAAS